MPANGNTSARPDALTDALRRHRLISERTIEALAERRRAGVRLGRPPSCPEDVLDRVLHLREAGAVLADIAAAMNAAGVPTPGGRPSWGPSHVHRLLQTRHAHRRRTEWKLRVTPPAASEGVVT